MHKKALTLVLSAMVAVTSVAAQQHYDPVKKQFLAEEGGLDEAVLNRFKYSPEEIRYLTTVDSVERQTRFISIDQSTDERNIGHGLIQIIEDYTALIEKLKKKPYAQFNEPTKELILQLRDAQSKDEITRIKNIFETLVQSYSQDGSPLEVFLGREKKNPFYIMPMVYSIFKELGIAVNFRVGTYLGKDTKEKYSTWLSVQADGKEFELDPIRYSIIFIPLEKRTSKPYQRLKDLI
jgi:hypothetical protein